MLRLGAPGVCVCVHGAFSAPMNAPPRSTGCVCVCPRSIQCSNECSASEHLLSRCLEQRCSKAGAPKQCHPWSIQCSNECSASEHRVCVCVCVCVCVRVCVCVPVPSMEHSVLSQCHPWSIQCSNECSASEPAVLQGRCTKAELARQ
jgi:hypothetical protein